MNFATDDTLQGSAWRLPLFVFLFRQSLRPRPGHGERFQFLSLDSCSPMSGKNGTRRFFCPEANLVSQPKGNGVCAMRNNVDNNAKLCDIVDRIMKESKPIRYDYSQCDDDELSKLLAILQGKIDCANKQHPGENLEYVLGKDWVDEYIKVRDLAAARGILIPSQICPE